MATTDTLIFTPILDPGISFSRVKGSDKGITSSKHSSSVNSSTPLVIVSE